MDGGRRGKGIGSGEKELERHSESFIEIALSGGESKRARKRAALPGEKVKARRVELRKS